MNKLTFLQEEYSNSKEAHASQLAVYMNDSRKNRKEAFKSSSAVLKLQEELKSTRSTMRITQQGIDMERRKVQQREQEAFEAQYQLVAVQEELDKLRAHLQTVQEEKDALKTSLKEEEVARIAAEGMIALPKATHDEDDLSSTPRRRSPSKRNASPFSDDKENAGVVTKRMLDTRRFDEELARERKMRQHAEELVEFLRLECHFRCCPCRSSDTAGHDQNLSVSNSIGETFEDIRNEMRAILRPSAKVDQDHDMEAVESEDATEEVSTVLRIQVEETLKVEMDQASPVEIDIPAEEFDRSVTMAEETPDERLVRESMANYAVVDDEELPEDETLQAPRPTPASLTPEPEHQSVESHAEDEGEEQEEIATPTGISTKVPLLPSSPNHDSQPTAQSSTPYRSVSRSYTTTIPMKFTPVKPTFAVEKRSYDSEEPSHELTAPPVDSPRSRHGSAPTFDRAAALAAIAYRRGRAKSIADGQMTPRKQMLQGNVNRTERRDVSAPTLGQKVSAANAHMSKGGSTSAGRAVGNRSRAGMR